MSKVKVPNKWKAAEVYAFLNMRITTLEKMISILVPNFKDIIDDAESIEDSGFTEATKAEMKEALSQLKSQL